MNTSAADLINSNHFKDCKRIVIKIGSTLLVDPESGKVHASWLKQLAIDINRCHTRNQEVVIVSSGAIAIGRRHLNFGDGVLKLEESQAAAATGMLRLAHAYEESLAEHKITLAQILLTLDDSENRRRYLNARNTLNTLLKVGAVPLINENDTVATDEIRFGDNDRLAARVAAMISADALVLLSDIDGLYSADPVKNTEAEFLPVVHNLTPEIEAMGGDSISEFGSGGMRTKLAAARIAMNAGCAMVITKGAVDQPLNALETGARCTWFLPKENPRTARKEWIAGSLKPHGIIVIDTGAVDALNTGKSLLPAGVSRVTGSFERGDAVAVQGDNGQILAHGLTAYSASDIALIMGNKTSEIEVLLGYRGRDEIIHRDDLVLI